jgi:type I restriction enzyme M protein
LKHFEQFLELLPEFKDSELSWTVDIQERRKTAADEAQPFKDEAVKNKQQTAQWKEKLNELKKAKPKDKDAIEEAEEKVKFFTKEAKEAERKAIDIENTVYDLKAVNPNKKPIVDTRTPEELLDIIEQKGKEIAEALAILRTSPKKQRSKTE